MGDIVVEFSAATQSLDALKEAAYRLMDQATCHLDEANGRYVCRLQSARSGLTDDELRARFLNLVTD